jgi:glutamate-5-semialdehyde dehydrogenase
MSEESIDIERELKVIRAAARGLRALPTETKNRVLLAAARHLAAREAEILRANAGDLAALPADKGDAFRDRLMLDSARIAHMADSLRQVAGLSDPVGEIVEQRRHRNGLDIRKLRAPLGVIFMIFESRPNVAIEAFSLGFKAGNAMILRGGKESARTVAMLYSVLRESLQDQGVSPECLWGITDQDRALVEHLLKQKNWIDVVVPRGGDGLIDFVTRTSLIPVIKNDRGLCHVYVHEDADLEMAEKIVVNAKCQRPGVCNAMETLLVHRSVAPQFLPRVYRALNAHGVKWFGCAKTLGVLSTLRDGLPEDVELATDKSFDTEHLGYKINSRVVDSLEEALAHIEAHGSRHSEAIITQSRDAALLFEQSIDAAAVYWNASTRFTDGFELGLGGELGISTQKLHVRGPVGLRELTSVRWVIEGEGQVRT